MANGLESLADIEYKLTGGVKGAPSPMQTGPDIYVPVVDELASAEEAKQSGASALEAFKKGEYGEAGLEGLLALLSAAGAVPLVGAPARGINRIIRRKNIKNNINQIPSGPIKIASQKKNKEGLLLDEEDNPVVVYHSTRSSEPFSEFDLEKGRYDFLSTSTQPDVAGRFGLSGDSYYKDEIATTGARLIPGMIKAKKTFDFENVKDTEDILNKFSKTIKKDINELDDVISKLETGKQIIKEYPKKIGPTRKKVMKELGLEYATQKSPTKISDYIDPNLLNRKQKEMVMFLHEFDNVPMPKAISQYLESNRRKLTEKLSDIFKKGIKEGQYGAIEDKDFLKVLKEEGYDSFTTFEEGGKNVMLLEPEKQFIPLFDEKKTSTLGYKKGGSVVERNPYNYTAKAI